MASYIVSNMQELMAIPTSQLRKYDTAVIEFRSPTGEIWSDEYRHWNGTEWQYDTHTDPPGDPGPRGAEGFDLS